MNRRGYCIFIHTLCQGRVPSVHESKAGDPPGTPASICIFDTEREAQLEIADFMMTRLQEFMDGERDFEDATSTEEYVVAVTVHPDGYECEDSGWPRGLRRFAAEAWRRADAGELTDSELYCLQACKSRIRRERAEVERVAPWLLSDHFAA